MTRTPFPTATVVGYPRVGRFRELKKAQEAFWKGKITQDELRQAAADVQRTYYDRVIERGLSATGSSIPATFSYYDQVLDAVRLFNLVPKRLADAKDARGLLDLPGYFALARGTETLPPLEMTKWFDTNYHYLVPEIGPDTEITLNLEAIDEQLEVAKEHGVTVRPQLVGPLTLLLGAKAEQGSPEGFTPLDRLDDFVKAYRQVLAEYLYRVTLLAVNARHVNHSDVHTYIANILGSFTIHQTVAATVTQMAVKSVGISDRNSCYYAVMVNLPLAAIAHRITGRHVP